MRKIYFILLILLATLVVRAQAPQKMSYQCVVRNASGALVTNQSVGIRISILQGTISGTVIYQETYNSNPFTNANGLLSIEIGSGIPLIGTFTNINWASGPFFLKTETDLAGGTNYTIVGTTQLLSVPYALYATTAGNGFSGNYLDLTNKPTLFSGNYNELTNKPILFSGNYNDLINKPILFGGSWNNLTDKPTTLNGYGITDAATKVYIDESIQLMEKRLFTQAAGGTVTDIDGNIYNTVKIGDYVWMAENLKTTKYRRGTPISLVTDNLAWSRLGSPVTTQTAAYCWYNNDEATYKNVYGALYSQYVTWGDSVCPIGWHFPTGIELSNLRITVDPEYVNPYPNYSSFSLTAGGKLKEAGTQHWASPNVGATNEFGFNALPGGSRYHDTGEFENIGLFGSIWYSFSLFTFQSSSAAMGAGAWDIPRNDGRSIRCVKD